MTAILPAGRAPCGRKAVPVPPRTRYGPRYGRDGLAQQSHMLGMSTVLGCDLLPELSNATTVYVFVPFCVA